MRYLRLSLLAVFLSTLLGCAANTNDPGTPPPGVDSARLEVLGSTDRAINEFAEELVEVRYVSDDGRRIPDVLVEFQLEGDASGATLSGGAATTNADGIASVTVRAGTQGRFDLVATAPLADPAFVSFDVRQMRFGSLDYTVTYGGMRLVRDAEVALFTNTTCEALVERVPTPRDVHYPRIGETKQFTDVEVGVPMAVYALGIDARDQVAAEACTNVTLDSPTGSLTIPLDDVAEIFGGEYETLETFDVTMGLPEALDMILHIMGGLADDPAAFIVDFVAELDEAPSWVRSALSWGPSRALVISLLRDVLDDIHVPGYVEDFIELGASFDRALSAMTLVGELTFPEPDEFGNGAGTHELRAMRVPVGAETAERPLRASADLAFTVGENISLPEHALRVPFGQLIDILLNDVLLPRLPTHPESVGDLISNLLDCRAISTRLAGDGSTTASVVNAVCELGATFLGAYVEEEIESLWSFDTLNLSGTAELKDTDGDYDRDRIQNGEAQARWTGSTGELAFTGTFNGSRLMDADGRSHPVRERMTELR